MSWGLYRNLQASLKDYLDEQIDYYNIQDLEGINIITRVGRKNDDDWTLSTISLYVESETAEKFEAGSNLLDRQFLIILDFYGKNEGDRADVAKWLTDTLSSGWRYYTYTYNPSDPDSPTKTEGGWVNVKFLTNEPVELGENVDIFDAHRHRISINVWITK